MQFLAAKDVRRRRHFQLCSLLIAAAAGLASVAIALAQSPAPAGAFGSQQSSPFAGSVPAQPTPGVMQISLQNAIDLGLKQNLGLLLANTDIQSARGERWKQLSELLPHVAASPSIDVSKANLAEAGISFKTPGLTFPISVGPFSYFDARINFSQSLFDWRAINKERSSAESLKSSEYTFKDARDLVVLAVGYTYLQAISDEARIETAQAQVNSAQAISNQASDQVTAGTSPAIDGLRARVQLQERQQQLIQARNDFAIQKLTFARVIGLASGQDFELTDKVLYQEFEALALEDALRRAYASRSDYQAALSDLRAAEYSRKAAFAGYFPSLSFNGDYGAGGSHPSNATEVYDVRGTLSIPIFAGNNIHGDILQADARLTQSRDRLANLRAQVDSDVRVALLNLQSSSQLVEVARSNIDLAETALTQSTDRFRAGVTDTVEVVQAQQSVASAHEQYISSLYSYNYAKISLARVMGVAEQGVREYFKGK